jgi:hypothetical protein
VQAAILPLLPAFFCTAGSPLFYLILLQGNFATSNTSIRWL